MLINLFAIARELHDLELMDVNSLCKVNLPLTRKFKVKNILRWTFGSVKIFFMQVFFEVARGLCDQCVEIAV